MDGSGEKRPKPPGAGNFGALGTTPFWENSEIVFQKQHAVDVKDFGNLLAPRQGHGRRGEIVDRRYQVDRLGGMSGRIELATRVALDCRSDVFDDLFRGHFSDRRDLQNVPA